jgi:hypothetical protein
MINKRLGYYTVGNVEFESKIQACIFANKTNQDVKWHFNKEVFENYSWHIEPELTLDQLYDKRAREIREKYDYVIISYSGGADSHNIVESFIRQGLHIDELIINTMEKGSSSSTILNPNAKDPENAAAEYRLQTVPRLKEIHSKSPKTKITILDLTDYLMSSWVADGDASWILKKKEGLNPLNATRFNYIYFNDVRKLFDKNKKIAVVIGVEKPRIFIYSNNKFYIRFTDRAVNMVSVYDHIKEYPNAEVELFYWSPDTCDLICKQAHIIKRWLEMNPQYQPLFFYKNITSEVYRLVHERVLRSIVYSSTWNDDWYQADKSTKDWYSEFDTWFIEGYKGTKYHNSWLEGVKYVRENAGNFVNTTNGYADGLKNLAYNFPVGEMYPPINLNDMIINK